MEVHCKPAIQPHAVLGDDGNMDFVISFRVDFPERIFMQAIIAHHHALFVLAKSDVVRAKRASGQVEEQHFGILDARQLH
jgi:hypothetical protein